MKTNEAKKANRAKIWPMLGALFMSAIIAMVESRPAQGATSCMLGESVDLIDPVVTVIEGPGDAAAEQAQWSALEYSGLGAPLEMGLGERTFELERAP